MVYGGVGAIALLETVKMNFCACVCISVNRSPWLVGVAGPTTVRVVDVVDELRHVTGPNTEFNKCQVQHQITFYQCAPLRPHSCLCRRGDADPRAMTDGHEWSAVGSAEKWNEAIAWLEPQTLTP